MRSIGVGLAVLLAATLAASACNRTNDDPKDRVQTALKNANLNDVNVDYDRDEHVVHLKGNVDHTADRTRAEEVAEKAVGTSGKVLNEVTVTGVDEKHADDNDGRIKDQLSEMIDRDPELKEHNIRFEVNNGAVEAKGTVQSAAEKERVSRMVREVPGVKDFANGIEVDPSVKRPVKDETPARRPAKK